MDVYVCMYVCVSGWESVSVCVGGRMFVSVCVCFCVNVHVFCMCSSV